MKTEKKGWAGVIKNFDSVTITTHQKSTAVEGETKNVQFLFIGIMEKI